MEHREIVRTEYLNRLRRYKDDTGFVKIITGMRRCGKSTLMRQYMSELKASGVSERNIVFMNMESLSNKEYLNAESLYEHLMSIMPKEMSYVFLDEIQKVDSWERAISSMMVDRECDIYLTGSNAYFLSTELSTFMTGRSIQIDMLPFSFKEFTEHNSLAADLDALKRYMAIGSMPSVRSDMDPERVFETLDMIRSDVIVKDIQKRKKITDNTILRRTIEYLFSEIGNPLSVHSVALSLGIDDKTADGYLSAITESLMFYRAKRYDLRGKKILTTNDKIYCTDLGMRNGVIGEDLRDRGRALENLVFLELMRRGYRVSVGKLGNIEVDFIASRGGKNEYFQVAWSVSDAGTLERELRPLEGIRNNLRKTLLTTDPGNGSAEGIEIRNIVEWLIDKE
ncbi:MAG: ATP-binding protein [Methanomassiliicoccaceae archaeon]|nr:ATP-binding protein [Methanomassiliicoccaceae archaeon]